MPLTSSAPLQQQQNRRADDGTASRVPFPVFVNASSENATPLTMHLYNRSSQYPHYSARQRRLWLSCLITLLTMAVALAILCAPRDEHSPRMMLHPLAALRQAPAQPTNAIRYLTFGSSSTWGEGLAEPQQQAFPYLLSKTVHNVASRIGGLSLSAICTQSIVEGNRNQHASNEKVYDVIVVEFQNNDAESVMHLAARLRLRFPAAMLIFVRLWTPVTDIVYRPEEKTSSMGLMEWWNQQPAQQPAASHDEPASTDPKRPRIVLGSFAFQSAVLNSDSQSWSFVDRSEQATMIQEVVQAVDGHIVSFPPLPTATTRSIPALLTAHEIISLFQPDQPNLLSPKGHQILAARIQKLVDDQHVLQRRGSDEQSQLGSWGKGDACHLWYATGDATVLRKRRRATLVDFSRETDGHKHALEISRKGGSVDVTNPFEEPRMLYLTYMTAAASDKDNGVREYPRTKISLGGKTTLMIDPIYDQLQHDIQQKNYHYDDRHHLTRTTAVGMVPPGNTVLRLDSLDAMSTTRFRLVGLHFLDHGKVPIPFEFDLEPDSAHR